MKETIMRIVMILVASVFLFATNVSNVLAADPCQGEFCGPWIGTWTSLNSPTFNGTITMNVIKQEGNMIEGTSFFGNTKCSPKRFFKGKISGEYNNFLKLKMFPKENPEIQLSKGWGAISRTKNAISTVYKFTNSESECKYDVGTMFVSKVQPYSQD
ncbi:MAG: hypothetical protein AB4352_22845 [Hormoscilla sp.]